MPVSPPPLVSILVCTFNRDRLLPGALRSLLAQTGIDQDATEIIVVDDGSTDATQRIIAELQRDSPIRIVAVTGAHVGLGAARNLAVSHARGAWLAFFDDDQIADPCWLSALLASASAAQVDGVGDGRSCGSSRPGLPRSHGRCGGCCPKSAGRQRGAFSGGARQSPA